MDNMERELIELQTRFSHFAISVKELDISVNGDDNNMGLKTKVAIMWKSYMVLWCSLSTVVGFIASNIVNRFF